MVIRGTPQDIEKYILVDNDDIIYQLSLKEIFPMYIDDTQAYFEKQNITLNVINEIMQKG